MIDHGILLCFLTSGAFSFSCLSWPFFTNTFYEKITSKYATISKSYSEPCQTSKMKRFTKKPLTLFAKSSFIRCLPGFGIRLWLHIFGTLWYFMGKRDCCFRGYMGVSRSPIMDRLQTSLLIIKELRNCILCIICIIWSLFCSNGFAPIFWKHCSFFLCVVCVMSALCWVLCHLFNLLYVLPLG